jgi:Holliday junction resolvase RusA-like endonuclease
MNNSYQFVITNIIPATQESFKKDSLNHYIRIKESKSVTEFKAAVKTQVKNFPPPKCFPASKSVFVAIIQYFTSIKKDYRKRDVDNMAKTVLDVLGESNFYKDDSQVRTLLVSKRVELDKIPQNLGFIYIRTLEENEDIEAIKILVEEAIKTYSEFKNILKINVTN